MPKEMTKFMRMKSMLCDNNNSIEVLQSQLNQISKDFSKWTENMLNTVHSKNEFNRNIKRIDEEKEFSSRELRSKRLRSEKNIFATSNVLKTKNGYRSKRQVFKTTEAIISKEINDEDFNTLEIQVKKEKHSVPCNPNHSNIIDEDKENELLIITTVHKTRQTKNSKTFNANNSLSKVVVKEEQHQENQIIKTKDRMLRKEDITSDQKIMKKLSNLSNFYDQNDIKIQLLEPIVVIINDSIKKTIRNTKSNDESLEVNNPSIINDNSSEKSKQDFDRNVESLNDNYLIKDFQNEPTKNHSEATQILNVMKQVKNVLPKHKHIGTLKCRTPVKQSNGNTVYLKNQQLLFNPLDSVKKKVEALEKLHSAEVNSTPLKSTKIIRTKVKALQINENCKKNVNEKDSSTLNISNVNKINSLLQEKQCDSTSEMLNNKIINKNTTIPTKMDVDVNHYDKKPLRIQPARGHKKIDTKNELIKKNYRIIKKPQQNNKHDELKKMTVKESNKSRKIKKTNVIKTKTLFHVNTDDETEDEETKKRVIPAWSKTINRQNELNIQFQIPNNIIFNLFGSRPTSINLKDLFPKISISQLKRRSSAVWTTPPRYSLMPKY